MRIKKGDDWGQFSTLLAIEHHTYSCCEQQGIIEAMDDVPVHIGGSDLKVLTFNAIYDRWLEYSGGFELKIDDLILRNGSWVKLSKDKDVIAAAFFRKVNNVYKFRNGKALVYLEMPDRLYAEFREWKTITEEKQVSTVEVNLN